MSISDHFGIGLRWKPGNICNQNSSHNTISYKKPKSVNLADLEVSIASAMPNIVHGQDVDAKLSKFQNVLLNFEKSNSQTVVRRVSKPFQPKWFNKKIKTEITLRNFYKASGHVNLFKNQRNKVVNMIKYEKANYYRNVLIKSKGDCRKLWKHFKEAIGKTPLITSPVLNIDGNTVIDLFEVTNAFNIYFTSVSSHVIEHLPRLYTYTPSIDFANFLANKLTRRQTFSLPHVTELTLRTPTIYM